MPDDHTKHLRAHEDYLYLFFDKPLTGIKMDFGCPAPGSIISTVPSPEDYYEEEEEEQEPLTIEFSL
jgi:hypothetical protein